MFRGVSQIRPTAPDPVDLLRHVHHLEVRREGSNEVRCRTGLQRSEQRLQLLERSCVSFPVRNGYPPGRFNQVEKRLAALLLDQLAHQLSQAPDITLECLVLLREEDVRATDGL